MTGNLGYYTFSVPDTEKGRDFFGKVLGWEFQPGDDLARYSHASNTTPPGGLVRDSEATGARVYFTTDDIQATVALVRELGGTAKDPSKSESGWSTDCRDNQGAPFSLWQPAPGF